LITAKVVFLPKNNALISSPALGRGRAVAPGRARRKHTIFSNIFILKHQKMDQKNGINIFFIIIAAVSGSALVKKFDPDVFKFNEPLTSLVYVIYILGFVASIIGLVRSYKNRSKV
jgi:hypothetical protein